MTILVSLTTLALIAACSFIAGGVAVATMLRKKS